MNKRIFLELLTCIFILGIGYQQIKYSQNLQNGLSGTPDPYSEANAIRAGEGYVDRGFTAFAGLPDICYGTRFPDEGHVRLWRDRGLPTDQWIYTHYPPGPDWLVGLATLTFGKGNISCFRFFPITFSIFCWLIFAFCLFQTIGPLKTLLLVFLLDLIPMATNGISGLHYQGYAMSLLFLQIGLVFYILRKHPSPVLAGLIFPIGFIQGFLSFDYFFLVSLAPIPLALLSTKKEGERIFPRALYLIVLSASGFILAHLVHFGQVTILNLSFHGAFEDLFGVAMRRLGVGPTAGHTVADRLKTLYDYFTFAEKFPPNSAPLFCGFNLLLAVAGVSLLCCVPKASATITKPFKICVRWTGGRRKLFAVISSLIISSLWIFLAHDQALEQRYILTRHFIFICVISLLILLDSWDITIHKNTSDTSPERVK